MHFGPSLVKAAKFSLQRQSRPLSCEGKDQKVTLTMIFFLPCKSVFKVIRTFLAYCSEDRSPVRHQRIAARISQTFRANCSEDRF